MGTYGVKEMTVMGYYYYSSRIIKYKILQPCDRLDIKVIGRLVKEDYLRIAEKRLRKKYLYLFITGKAAHLGIQDLLGKSETLDKL